MSVVSYPAAEPAIEPGSMGDYDLLASRLNDYEDAPAGFGGVERELLDRSARRCGWPGGDDLIAWSHRRVATYRRFMAGAVADLLTEISVNNSLTRRIGE